ncbi:MAG: mRNA surveillance protein Pelota [Nitrososphaeraceae archaeon]|jgi:protein pelota|nr:mRNA surveillance protein Pelota [Nitrososphaeraceae archaeon]
MIVRDSKHSEKSKAISAEDLDDLFTLRRIIEINDTIITDTTRSIKQKSEFSRPDKGERVKIRILLRIETIKFDGTVDRIRIGGTILNSDNQLVPKGVHHSISIKVDDMIILEKKQWKKIQADILKNSGNDTIYLLISIDTQEAAIALVTGTHVKILPNIYSGQSGKRFQGSRMINSNIDSFFEEILLGIRSVTNLHAQKQMLILFGPGETKRRFFNFLAKEFNEKITVLEGIDVAGEDGIFVSLRSTSLKELLKASKIGIVSSMLDKLIYLIHSNDPKYAIGVNEVRNAVNNKSIESLIYSNSILEKLDEGEFIDLLNSTEAVGAKIYGVDASTDIGLRVSSLGGIVGLLRFAIR